jgi:hypothetical protein
VPLIGSDISDSSISLQHGRNVGPPETLHSFSGTMVCRVFDVIRISVGRVTQMSNQSEGTPLKNENAVEEELEYEEVLKIANIGDKFRYSDNSESTIVKKVFTRNPSRKYVITLYTQS